MIGHRLLHDAALAWRQLGEQRGVGGHHHDLAGERRAQHGTGTDQKFTDDYCSFTARWSADGSRQEKSLVYQPGGVISRGRACIRR